MALAYGLPADVQRRGRAQLVPGPGGDARRPWTPPLYTSRGAPGRSVHGDPEVRGGMRRANTRRCRRDATSRGAPRSGSPRPAPRPSSLHLVRHAILAALLRLVVVDALNLPAPLSSLDPCAPSRGQTVTHLHRLRKIRRRLAQDRGRLLAETRRPPPSGKLRSTLGGTGATRRSRTSGESTVAGDGEGLFLQRDRRDARLLEAGRDLNVLARNDLRRADHRLVTGCFHS